MKILKILSLCILMSIATPIFAYQVCPAEIQMDRGNAIVPAGWHVTRNELSPLGIFLKNMTFDIAVYNLAGLKTESDGEISCQYFGNERSNKISLVEITNDQKGFPIPSTSGTKWLVQDNTGYCQNPSDDTKPEECPWG